MSLNKENRSSRRANASLLSVDRTPQNQSEDFFTDSLLDASKVPTPSPKRQPFHKTYKERRAIGNSIALRSAWQSNGSDSLSDTDRGNPSTYQLRPTELPSPGRSPSPLRQFNGTSTPPPEISPTSPSIVSSPAHGLDETYKRIAEEEDIAAQEGQLEDEDEYTDSIYHNEDHGLGQDTHHSDKSQASELEHKLHDDRIIDRDKENVPLEDGTVPTQVSDMSFLEGLTDQGLAAKLTPHAVQAAKDRALLAKASQRQTPINFKGTKNGPTLSERLRRKSISEIDKITPQEEQKDPQDDTDDFREPPPNVPRSWVKARPEKDWMIRSRQKRQQGRMSPMSSPGFGSSQVDWAAAAAEVALPSVEDDFIPKETVSKNPSPATLHSQRSLDRVRQWELNDFTGQSLQVSDSPPVRPRTKVVDQIQQREIERLEKQAVTSNRLGQYRKREDPNVLIRKLTRRKSLDTYPIPEPSATPPPSGFHPSLIKAITVPESSQTSKEVKLTDNGEPIPGSPIVIYRSTSISSNSTSKDNGRPSGGKKALDDQLARLARSESSSPKPSLSLEDRSSPEPAEEKAKDSAPEAEREEPVAHYALIEKVVKENQEAARRAESSRQSSKEFPEEETTPKANRIAESAKTPKVIGAWTDTILPDTVLRTIRKRENDSHGQTPHVRAGGWIETPAPEGKRQSSALAPIPIEEDENEDIPVPEGLTNGISKPQEEPKSEGQGTALGSLLARAKSRLTAPEEQTPESNDTLRLGDSTINSMEDLLTLDNAELTTLIRMGAESEAREQLIRDHLGAEPIAEAQLLERLSGKLHALRTNIHDARKGISKLEHQVATRPETTSGSSTALTHQSYTCHTCGAPSSTYLISITLPFAIPHLLHTRQPGEYLPRPTWLGWLTIMSWLWYLAESAMLNAYGHPLYAYNSYIWPVEPEPYFPLVLPTMLWRWGGRGVLRWLLGPVWWVCVAVFRVIGQMVGWTDGFVDDGINGVPVVGRVMENIGVGVEDVAAAAMGMDGDVFL
jgi:hypothetical protein